MSQPPYQPNQPQPYQPHYQPYPVAVVPTSGTATAALVCGIGALFTCGFLSIPAVICGHLATRETKTGLRGGHGMAVTGLILGWVTLVPWIAFWVMIAVGAISAPFLGSTTAP